jgi:16S rRNA (guanine966-N2)-methyltransferase
MMAILAPDSEGVRALDLFAGTGRVGLKLLDQGAGEVTFVESDAKAASELRRRLKGSEHWPACRLLVGRIPKVLERLQGRFSLMLADPPYDWEGSATLLPLLAAHAEPEAILVVEHHHKTLYPESDGWSLYRQQKYGETRLSFFRLTIC